MSSEPSDQATPDTEGADAPEQAPTGLGSGTASGLGHSLTSEPEPLLGDEHTEDIVEDEQP